MKAGAKGADSSRQAETQASWRGELTPDQLRAVTHDGDFLLISAGAGTGKTKTLVARVAELIDRGTDPSRILLLTFSRRAAREMLTRAGTMIGAGPASRVWGGTFHSVAHRLLRRFGSFVGIPPAFTVIDQSDARELMGLARSEIRLDRTTGRRFPRKETLVAIYSRVANSQRRLGDVLGEEFPWCRDDKDEIAEVFAEYQRRKRATCVLDYDDLLLFWRALMTGDPGRQVVGEMFDHVLIDEYQDVNVLQGSVVTALGNAATGVTAVGDDAQAIYSFRGASSAAMGAFESEFGAGDVVTLDHNFRSTPEILGVANAVIADAADLRPKQLWSERRGGPIPTLTTCLDETAQAVEICDTVLDYRERGIDLRDQAVLFRTGHHSDGLELELARRRIPYVKFGGLKFLEAAHVRDLLALLRILENPLDELAWIRSIGLIEGIGPVTTSSLLDGLGVRGSPTPPEAVVGRLADVADLVPKGGRAMFDEFVGAITECAQADPPLGPGAEVDRLRDFCDAAFERRYASHQARLADIDQLGAMAGRFESRSEFLAELSLDPPASTSDLAGPPYLDDDYLVLSTIHSAKGGEWRVVHLMHAADGCIPSDMATGSAAGIEEERRLMYVAVTRARDALHVTYPLRFYHERRRTDDPHSYALPSRFLEPAMDCLDQRTAGFESADDGAANASAEQARDAVDTGLVDLWV